MNKLKDILMVVGIVLAGTGIMLTPFPYVIQGTKYGNTITDAGLFKSNIGLMNTEPFFRTRAVIVLGIGIIFVILSLIIKRKKDDTL